MGSLGQESNAVASCGPLASPEFRNELRELSGATTVVLLASFLSEEVPFPRWHLFFCLLQIPEFPHWFPTRLYTASCRSIKTKSCSSVGADQYLLRTESLQSSIRVQRNSRLRTGLDPFFKPSGCVTTMGCLAIDRTAPTPHRETTMEVPP